MKKKEKWLISDIDLMQSLYLNHHSIKEIAATLGRSVTSANKMLSRTGIRLKRPLLLRSGNKPPRTAVAKLRRAGSQPKWVTLEFVIAWLQKRNILINRSACPSTGQIFFCIENSRFSAGELVSRFNQKRLQEGLESYFVEGVSWE